MNTHKLLAAWCLSGRSGIIFLTLLIGLSSSGPPDDAAYRIFPRDKDKAISYNKFVRKIRSADIILFGENHRNATCHELELQLEADLYEDLGEELILGAEMFESDDQLVIDEFMKGLISEDHFKHEAKIWTNYDEHYAPLLHFARAHQIRFIGTNIPRRYANLVAREGLALLDSIPKEGLQYICPLPLAVDMDLPGYQYLLKMMVGHGGSSANQPENLVHAQAIKDATMAHFILENHANGNTFLHFNGAFHSNNFEGIYYYLNRHDPSLKIITISTVLQDTIGEPAEDNKSLGDYIVAIKSN